MKSKFSDYVEEGDYKLRLSSRHTQRRSSHRTVRSGATNSWPICVTRSHFIHTPKSPQRLRRYRKHDSSNDDQIMENSAQRYFSLGCQQLVR